MAIGIPEQIDLDEKNKRYRKSLKRDMSKRRRIDGKRLLDNAHNGAYYRGYSN